MATVSRLIQLPRGHLRGGVTLVSLGLEKFVSTFARWMHERASGEGMLTIQTCPSRNGIIQTQLEDLQPYNVFCIFRAHKDGIRVEQGSNWASVTPELALEFANSIIAVVETQRQLNGVM